MSDGLDFSATLDQTTIPGGDRRADITCLLEISPSEHLSVPEARCLSTSVCLVIDCSLSMSGSRMEATIDAANLIVDTIDPRHRVSLVAFQSTANLLIDNAQATDTTKGQIKDKIKQLHSYVGGTTKTSQGIALGTRTLAECQADAKVMIVLSDGNADAPRKAEQAAIEAARAGIQIFAVGIGSIYSDDGLLSLVTPSNGAVFGERDADKIKWVFSDLVERIDNFVANNTLLFVTFHEDVELGPAYKTSPDEAYFGVMCAESDGRVHFRVGNIERDKTYRFSLSVKAPKRERGELEIARAELSYDVPSLDLSAKERVAVSVRYIERQRSLPQLPHHPPTAPVVPAKNRYGEDLYDVVLLDPGESPIRVIREIRDATGLALRTVARIVARKDETISKALPHEVATRIQKKVEGVGARVVVKRSDGAENPAKRSALE